MESDKVSSILDKIESKAGLIGGVLGFLGDPMAYGRGFSSATLEFMMERLKGWKIPNVSKTFDIMMANPAAYPIFDYAFGALGGWVLQQAGSVIDGKLTAVGRIVKKLSVSALFANIASGFLWIPAINPGGAGGAGNPAYTVSPQFSGSVGGPGTPHASSANGYRSNISFEKVCF